MNAIANPLDPSVPLPARAVVLVGMPGAGKSSVGKRLAARLGLRFVDSDSEVETAAGMKIPDIFDKLGESAFREGERRVIARLLDGPPVLLATGGGTFMDPDSRRLILDQSLAVWLRAPLEVLLTRTGRRNDRPLLNRKIAEAGSAEAALRGLLEARESHYAQAHLTVATDDRPTDQTATRVLQALTDYVREAFPSPRSGDAP